MSSQTTTPRSKTSTRRVDSRPTISENPAPSSTIEDTATRAIAQLFTEHGALSVVHWKTNAGGEAQPVDSQPDIHPELLLKTSELAKRAIEQGSTLSRLFSSRHQQYLVASPIVSDRGYAITVAFPLVNDANLQERSAVQSRDVALLAAQLTIVRLNDRIRRKDTAAAIPQAHTSLKADPVGAQPSVTIPPTSTGIIAPSPQQPEVTPTATENTDSDQPPSDDAAEPTVAENTWLSIASQVKAKLIGALHKVITNRKTTLATLLGVSLLSALPWPHTVKSNVVCEPSNRRFVAAPFDSKLLKAHVVPGQEVAAGAVLASLDGGELRSEIVALEAKLAQAKQRRSAALTKRDASKAEFERMEIRHLQGELDLAYSRQTNLEIVSPIDGIVVMGDLERAEGATLSTGDTLFEIAPLDRIVAEIAIDESEIAYVKQGMTTSIVFDGSRSDRFESVLTSIHPRSEIRDGENVFIAEAELENVADALRPGMRGSARVAAGNRPLIWILFHKPYEAARQLIGW